MLDCLKAIYRCTLATLFGLIALGMVHSLRAQESVKETPAPVVEEVGPPTVYLKDEKGKLVPVAGISYERFRELLLLERRLGSDAPPTYVLEKIAFTGKVHELEAELTAEITVLTRQAGWTMFPLSMANALLHKPLDKNSLEMVHRYDAKTGHTLWLNGAENKRFTLQLPLVVPVKRLGLERQLALSLPRASETEFSLQIPYRIADFELTAGEGIVEKKLEKETTNIKVVAASGELALAWKSANDLAAHAAHDLEVNATIIARVETRDVISADALLRLKRTSRNIDTVFVRYPPRFEPALKNGAGFTMSLATAEELAAIKLKDKKLSPGTIVRIDCDRPTDTCEISLTADYKPETNNKRALVDVSGFEVLDAGRQTGQVSIAIPKGWLLKPTTDSAVFRLDDFATDVASEPRSTTKYRFVKQPFSLKFDVLVQPTRTSVETVHVAQIDKRTARLESTFHFRVRGPRSEFLDFELGDWQLASVGPPDLVALEAPVEPGKTTRIRLLPTGGADFTLQLQLQKEWKETTGPIAFELPRAMVTQLLPAVLAVIPSDNISLTPLSEAMPSLLAENRLPPTFIPLPEQAKFFYREIPQANEKLKFVGEIQSQPGRVTATVLGRVRFQPTLAEIEQQLQLQVSHDPITGMTFELPESIDMSNLRFSLGEQPLMVTLLTDATTIAETTQRLIRVNFPTPQVGKLELMVHYQFPLPPEDSFNLPLILPAHSANLTIASQSLQWESVGNQRFELLNATERHNSAVAKSEGIREATWQFSTPVVPFVRQLAATNLAAVFVEKAWLQIWLTDDLRRDRFVAQFISAQHELSLRLPQGVDPANTRVLIDNAPPAAVRWKDGQLHITLSDPAEAMNNAVMRRMEVWYLLPLEPRHGVWQTTACHLPRFLGPSAPQQYFLQLLTSPSREIIGNPTGFSAYMMWQKRDWWWTRSGSLTTGDLEAVFQVTPQPLEDLPVSDALFISLGAPEVIEITLGQTRWLWLLSAGSVLIGGWLVLVLSHGHRFVLLLTIAIVIFALTILMPETALSLSRYLGLGLLLLFASTWSLRFASRSELRHAPQRMAPRNARTESRSKAKSALNMETTTSPASFKEVRP